MDKLSKTTAVNDKWLDYLVDNYGAEGTSLHTAIDSVEPKLPADAIRKLRYIATIRNVSTHEDVDVATREWRNVDKTDRRLDAIFSTHCKRRPTDRRRFDVRDENVQTAKRLDKRRSSFVKEATYWLGILAIVGGYCYWRFIY